MIENVFLNVIFTCQLHASFEGGLPGGGATVFLPPFGVLTESKWLSPSLSLASGLWGLCGRLKVGALTSLPRLPPSDPADGRRFFPLFPRDAFQRHSLALLGVPGSRDEEEAAACSAGSPCCPVIHVVKDVKSKSGKGHTRSACLFVHVHIVYAWYSRFQAQHMGSYGHTHNKKRVTTCQYVTLPGCVVRAARASLFDVSSVLCGSGAVLCGSGAAPHPGETW